MHFVYSGNEDSDGTAAGGDADDDSNGDEW